MLEVKCIQGSDHGNIVLYGLSTCGWCAKTKKYLEMLGVGFSYIHVDLLTKEDKDSVLKDLKEKNSRLSFPTLVVDGQKVVIGYSEPKIKEAVGL